jgi:3-dehydroquinate dehydratase-1
MGQVKIGGAAIGDGSVKTCMSVAAGSERELFLKLSYAVKSACDIIEWRADYWEEKGEKPFAEIKRELWGKPLIFTYRTRAEGGLGADDASMYQAVNEEAILSGCADAVDIEFEKDKGIVRALTCLARERGVKVIISKHTGKPGATKDEIAEMMLKLFCAGGDIAKLAVCAGCEADAKAVIEAAKSLFGKYPDKPFITVGMGEAGRATRYKKPFYGSSVTYVKGFSETALGQLSIEEL